MKNKIRHLFQSSLVILATVGLLQSCNDIIEANLSNTSLTVLAPVDNLVTTDSIHVFAWQTLDGSKNYQIQIVSPKFDSVTNFIIDTTTSKTNFTYKLTPKRYQWRVRALNNNSQSPYITRNLTIQ